MSKHLTKCQVCGNNVFIMTEEISYKSAINKTTGALETFTVKTNDITNIRCTKCNETYDYLNFKKVIIN